MTGSSRQPFRDYGGGAAHPVAKTIPGEASQKIAVEVAVHRRKRERRNKLTSEHAIEAKNERRNDSGGLCTNVPEKMLLTVPIRPSSFERLQLGESTVAPGAFIA